MIDWLWPWAFAALPLPWLVRRLTSRRTLQQPALVVPSMEDFSAITTMQHKQGAQSLWRLMALSLAWALLLAAVARSCSVRQCRPSAGTERRRGARIPNWRQTECDREENFGLKCRFS